MNWRAVSINVLPAVSDSLQKRDQINLCESVLSVYVTKPTWRVDSFVADTSLAADVNLLYTNDTNTAHGK